MSERENRIWRSWLFGLDFARLSVTRHQRESSHAEPPVNDSATTVSLGHRVYRPATIECPVRLILSLAVVHFLVIEAGPRCHPVLPRDHRGDQAGDS